MSNEEDLLTQDDRRKGSEDGAGLTRHLSPLRITVDGPPAEDPCEVVVEDVLTIMIEGHGNIAIMCTPTETVALAVGFLFAEGLINGMEDVVLPAQQADPHVVAVRLVGSDQAAGGRDLIVSSSCGMCGSRHIDELMTGLKSAEDTLRVPLAVLRDVAQRMRNQQRLFARTGGTHAAAVFSAEGDVVAMGEDIGRHNALDKAVGKCLLGGRSLRQRGAMLSGRISLEMIAKCAQAGIELVAAVSAPTSLAIIVAERCNITLCGFVREDRATVYTHPHRIKGVVG